MSERSRLAWSCRRGMLELDLLLQGFIERGFDKLNERQVEVFERLLAAQDQTLIEWLMERETPDEKEFIPTIAAIRAAT